MTHEEYFQRVPEGIAYVDGEYRPLQELTISIADLGYTQGAATYDVAHVVDNRFFRLDWHLQRFLQSADELELPITYSTHEITEILRECVIRSGYENAFVWMGVTQGIPRTGNPRDYETAETRFYAYAKEYYGISNERNTQSTGVNISISDIQRIPPESVDPTVKNHHWLDLRRAQIEAKRQGYDTTVLIDRQGNIAKGPGFNIAAVHDNRVITPRGNSLEGVTLRALREIAKELGINFERRDITSEELKEAKEAFLTSTSGGITPVLSIDRHQLTGHGEITGQLIDAYWKKHEDPAWTTPVSI